MSGDTHADIQKFLAGNPKTRPIVLIIGAIIVLCFGFFGHDILYFLSLVAEMLRTFGVMILLAKILKDKSVKGLSRKTQELYIVVFLTRFCFKVFFEGDILYPLVEGVATVATIYIVFLMRNDFQYTYSKQEDTFRVEFIVLPCILLSLIFHPNVTGYTITDILWTFSTYLESLTLLPQLFVIQRLKECDQITAHYMVMLGLSRALECFFWLTAFVILGYSFLYTSIGWYVISSELVHTLLLADFYYVYYQAWKTGGKMQLPGAALNV